MPFRGWGIRYLFLAVLRDVFRDDVLAGTFAPFSRASLSPIAIACFRLVTFRPELLFNVPFFFRRIADSTRLLAPLPYLAMSTSGWDILRSEERRVGKECRSRCGRYHSEEG